MESIRELRKIVAKSSASHYAPRHDVIVRKISIYFTWLLLHTPISANQVTVLQIVVGVIGGLMLMPASYAWNLAGIALLQLSYVLDCSDGEVARYRKQSSVNGVFLDLIGHEIVIPLMYFGLAVGEFQRSGRVELLVLGFAAGLFSLRFDISAMFQTVNTLFAKADNPSYNFETLQSGESSKTTELATSKPSLLRVLFRYPESMNLMTLLLLVDAWLGRNWLGPVGLVGVFLLVYGLLIPLARAYAIFRMMKHNEVETRYREIVAAVLRQKRS